MGLFGDEFYDQRARKETADWSRAVQAAHRVDGKQGFIMISDGRQTVVPKAPWVQYKEEAQDVSEWYMLFFNNTWGEVIGHTDYAKALKKLEEFTLDSNEQSLLTRRITEEELDSLVEVRPERANYFNYVGEMPREIREEIDWTFQKAVRVFKISDPADGRGMAEEIMNLVDDILETGRIPDEYGDIADVAVALGVMFGQALCCGYGWTWKVFGDSPEKTSFGVVSPEENFCNAPMPYLLRILSGQNINSYGENDNTVLLLYNMLENIDKKPKNEKYYPLA